MEKRSTFIRDLLVKILLIALFLFLLMYLFPMPNLTPFYSAIFNNNIQTMKEAAEDYYTVKRMPTEDGKSVKMTLKEMEDKKLILPFVDKNGKACNKNKSYVKVTKDGDEYVLKVSLTCSDESNYIIERIGCHDFCNNGTCSNKPVVTTTEEGEITVKVPTGKTVKEYEYKKDNTTSNWKLGDWRDSKVTESDTVKLNDTRTLYTGQKKVTANTTLYEQIAYGYNDNWTIGNWQDKTEKETNTRKLHDKRTQYTGQKKVTANTTLYEQIAYGYNDNWTIGNWQDKTEAETETLKLHDTRTQYTGQKKVTTTDYEYKHIKYGYKDNWTIGEWVNNTEKETDTHKLYSKRTIYTGQKLEVVKTTRYEYAKTKYVLTKSADGYTTSCSDWKQDSTWYSSRPANTSSRTYGNSYNSRTKYNWVLVQSSYKSYTTMPATASVGGTLYKYELVSKVANDNCGSNCATMGTIYYYNVYKQDGETTEFQYLYKDCTTTTQTYTDTKTVYTKSDYNYLINQGYTLKSKTVEDKFWSDNATAPANYEWTGETGTRTTNKYISLGKWVTSKEKLGEYTYNISTATQYKYADNNRTKYVIDTKWTKSKTPESGYEYTGESKANTKTSYVDLGKWVNSKAELGEYNNNIKTRTQYRYKTLDRTKFIKDTIWTTTNVATSGYVLTGNKKTTSKTTYIDLGRWVNSKSELGEYTYNIVTRNQYRYKTLDRTRFIKDTIWTTTNVATSGYVLTGNKKTTSKTTYIDLGYWVNSKAELGEYTYNVKTKTQYRYKYLEKSTSTEYMWSEKDPGNGWKATGKSRDKFIQTGYKEETKKVQKQVEKQKECKCECKCE